MVQKAAIQYCTTQARYQSTTGFGTSTRRSRQKTAFLQTMSKVSRVDDKGRLKKAKKMVGIEYLPAAHRSIILNIIAQCINLLHKFVCHYKDGILYGFYGITLLSLYVLL